MFKVRVATLITRPSSVSGCTQKAPDLIVIPGGCISYLWEVECLKLPDSWFLILHCLPHSREALYCIMSTAAQLITACCVLLLYNDFWLNYWRHCLPRYQISLNLVHVFDHHKLHIILYVTNIWCSAHAHVLVCFTFSIFFVRSSQWHNHWVCLHIQELFISSHHFHAFLVLL